MSIQEKINRKREAVSEFMKGMPPELRAPIVATFDDFVEENEGTFVSLCCDTGTMKYALVPESMYPGAPHHCGYWVSLYRETEVRFLDGERPRAMRGSLLTHNRSYEGLDYWQSQILKRYVQRVDKPTLIYKQELMDYADGLRKRLRERRQLRGKCVHTGRRIPTFPGDDRSTTRDCNTFFGVDDERVERWEEARIMIRGKLLRIRPGADRGLWRGKLQAVRRLHREINRLEKVT